MKRLCLLAVVATAVVTLCTAKICPDYLGPHGVTFVPHETNCSAYYRCTNTGPKLQICPSYRDMGQLCYNRKLQICDWSANVRCCNPFIPDDKPDDGPIVPTDPPDVTGCSAINGKRPHASCLKYTLNGEALCCGANWAFNPIICLCDLRRNVPSCNPTESELKDCNQHSAGRLSPLGRFVDVVYGDNQPAASNDDSLITAE